MNNECDIQVRRGGEPTTSVSSSYPNHCKVWGQDPGIVNLKPPFFFLLIIIQAGIVSPVYVRLVIIVVINDSSILTTGLNTTLEYLQSAPHNKTRNTFAL